MNPVWSYKQLLYDQNIDIAIWSKYRYSSKQNCVICKWDHSGPAACKISCKLFSSPFPQ